MRGKPSLRALLGAVSLCAIVAFGTGSSSAAPIYEPFAYDAGAINGQDGGNGFSGPWVATRNNPPAVEPGLTWGTLSVGGNAAQGNAWSGLSRPIGTTLSDASLMDNGATLWFSVILNLEGQNVANADISVALCSDKFVSGAFGDRENLASGEGIGVTHSRAVVQGVYWQDSDADTVAERVENNSSVTIDGLGGNLSQALVVGKIEWGADDTADETLTLYGPAADLTMGAPIMASWAIPALDQSQFDRVSVQFKDTAKIDEIRFGAAYEDVAVPEPASLALLAFGGLAALRRRRSA